MTTGRKELLRVEATTARLFYYIAGLIGLGLFVIQPANAQSYNCCYAKAPGVTCNL